MAPAAVADLSTEVYALGRANTRPLARGATKELEAAVAHTILLGFLAVIGGGAGLLMLPAATAGGPSAGFVTALFTSASAVCVTGLIVEDTPTYWSGFGQAVILVLIQLGGLE